MLKFCVKLFDWTYLFVVLFFLGWREWFSYFFSNSVNRAETLEIKNKGLPTEETIVTGQYGFEGADGYRYIIKYVIDKSGNKIEIDKFSIHRIPPNVLKSLIG